MAEGRGNGDPSEISPPADLFKNYWPDALVAFDDAIREAGIDFAVFLPDSILDGVAQTMQQRREVPIFQCSREDEGVAMAMGAYLAGKMPVVMMEGSGVGLSGLILARGMAQHTGTLLLVSHNSTLGERFDYHASSRLAAEPILRALNIPCHVLNDISEVGVVLKQACNTVRGQQIPVAVLVPPYILREG
jgi:sulfopyruvate decarboxylase TPP-binding subunit